VTLSPAAAELLLKQAPSAVLSSRGLVPIKGKGTMELFFLESPPSMVDVAAEAPDSEASVRRSTVGRMHRLSDYSFELTVARNVKFL